ncbi:8-oxo-dGTP diphosphatase [Stackebrandtia albiflava]|uniref:8-oxo-dGTP diphosphatase n=1 Tax=Stackebrandtia albiflava TaxID=406432 RepID=A0A562VAG2_9ACTN|nr:NUDIX domain-containing protein [Stackebrandtia albiflava]TWJ14797.1 8-oxo-dGTP diphosphatase [Stackebrandtia albiflava]
MDNQPKQVHAAGGVLWRNGDSGIEVVGVYRPSPGNWSLPKGKLAAGEHRLLGACREVAEETGLSPVPQRYLTRATYRLSHPDGDITKTVDFWSMRARDPRAGFVVCDEVSQQRWLSLPEAERLLTRPRDRAAMAAFSGTPPVTATILLLRHAAAEPESYPGADAARPLTAAGVARSAELVELLTLFDSPRVVSASPRRCVASVTPTATALGVPVTGESVFDAEMHPRHPERAATRLRELALAGGAVVCSQAPVIADTLAILADTDDVPLADVHTPPGGVWALSFADKELVAAERL